MSQNLVGNVMMLTCQDVLPSVEHVYICSKVFVDAGLLGCNVPTTHDY